MRGFDSDVFVILAKIDSAIKDIGDMKKQGEKMLEYAFLAVVFIGFMAICYGAYRSTRFEVGTGA
ncbi:MAG: hypothetical protein SPG65_01415 [Campylobacter sp.]|uniref:hypothetical protein n=1 Tax=Campylobacter sp. TaxID=205 RepID=UPI002A7595C1|nr:hypothetical protein [Campylobacter sp.]MDY3245476.1 hypothetical protein [Campylobacter sp.]MDY5383764.1 hypothetical protein [Campylobacter sp.]